MTDCDHFSDDYELYALGLLESPEREALEAHLASGCENCTKEVNDAIALNALISGSVPAVESPALLRRRIVESFLPAAGERVTAIPFPVDRPAPAVAIRRPVGWMTALAAAAMVIVALAAGWTYEHRARMQEEDRLQAANAAVQTANATAQTNAVELARMATLVEILQSPGVKQVTFGPQPATPHGSLFIQNRLGILLVAGGLPAAPAGSRYQSWIVPKTGAPRAIEPFQANAEGRAVSLIPGPVNLANIKAVAVSIEPANVPATTPTKVIFAAPVGE